MKLEKYQCLSCDHEFQHRQGAHRVGDKVGGPPEGCPKCGHKYLKWLRWYAVHTQPRTEGAVMANLSRLGYEVFCPRYRATVRHARRISEALRPFFPRYVFVGLTEGQGFYTINTLPGVSTVVYGDAGPLQICDGDMELLRSRANEDGLMDAPKQPKTERERMKRGREIRIVEGVFTGYPAIVELDKGHEITVLIEWFKRRVKASFQPEALSPELRSLS